MPEPDDTDDERLVAGRYRLRRVLGHGSMGTVWVAYDEVLHRPVAVKEVRCPPGMPENEAQAVRERTLREARAIAVLSHPNVITVHDVARENGEPYVVMELMPALSLAELVARKGRLDTQHAAAVADAVAAALDAAHRAGITHRDVKPGNVLVGEDGRIKLTDFGIARNVSEVTMTQSGMMLGSPAFIAPEVASGAPVTRAADLWGLGATLFAAIEGHPPYDVAGDALATVTEVVHGEVPRAASAGPLEPVISALMVKDPQARISLLEVRRRIHSLLPAPDAHLFGIEQPDQATQDTPTEAIRSEPQPERTPATSMPLAADPGPLPFAPRPRRRRRRGKVASAVVAVLAVVLFAVTAGGGFALARTLAGQSLLPPPAPEPTQAPPAPPVAAMTQRTADAITATGAQGGRFTVNVPKNWSMYVEQRTSQKLPSSVVVRYLSPDGSQELTVERFDGFYPKHRLTNYLDALPGMIIGNYTETLDRPLTGVREHGSEGAQQLTYRTSETSGPGTSGGVPTLRTTYADLLPDDTDLWVVSVTVPTDQEDHGLSELFDKIAPTFSPAG